MTSPRPAGTLPPGQRARADHPRFGLPWYAHRLPATRSGPDGDPGFRVELRGPSGTVELTQADLAGCRPREQVSDLHCVSTWSHRGLRWRGVAMDEFHRVVAVPRVDPGRRATHVRFVGADGYRDTLPIADALAGDVLLADGLGGEDLTPAHGAPLRVVAPAHYGYKSIKHLVRIEFLVGPPRRPPLWIKHPRARAAEEERFAGLPTRVVRVVYRAIVPANVWWFRRFEAHQPAAHPAGSLGPRTI